MGTFMYAPGGGQVFVKDPMQTTQFAAQGYTFSEEEIKVEKTEGEKLLTKPQTMALLKEKGIEFNRNAKVADLRALIPVEKDDTGDNTDNDTDKDESED